MIIGVVGAAGSIGSRHATNLLNRGHRVYGFDPHPLPAALFALEAEAQRSGITHRSRELDALVIATPTEQHETYVLQGIADDKHLFIEKPLALARKGTTAKWRKLLQASGKHIAVGFNLRFHPGVVAAKKKLQSVDAPYFATFILAQASHKHLYLRDGVIDNWMCHEIDLALHLLGPARLIYAVGDDMSTDIMLQHESGCRTHIHADYIAEEERRYFKILTKTGHVELDLVESPVINAHYDAEIAAFATLLSKNTNFSDLATAEDGLRCMQICEDAISARS